jgi:hypothetical protein
MYDWYLVPTSAYWSVKKGCSPRQLIYNYGNDKVYAVNDEKEDIDLIAKMKVYDLDNEEEFEQFARGASRELKVYGTDKTVTYDPQKRIGVMISKIGASKAISLGAYAFALNEVDKR